MPSPYPHQASLRDGRRVLIRPFESRDTEALWRFFQRLPADVRRFAWDDIGNRELIESWGRYIDYGKVFPLLAIDGNEIVADASLHRRSGGPLRRVGRVKWLLDPEWRGVGLGTTLVNHLMKKARDNGLRHLSCMLIADLERDAIETLERLGFDSLVVPGYGTDPDGDPHDMVKLWVRL